MPKVKAWKNKLNLAAYEKSQVSIIQVIDNINRERIGEEIAIPIAIMYRLYHLGRAYDFQVMKLLHPESNATLDRLQLAQLCSELECFSEIVIDPVIAHFAGLLVPLLQDARSKKGAGMVIVSPPNAC